MPKLTRQKTPTTKVTAVRKTDADVIKEKKRHCKKVKRNVSEANIADQPTKYKREKTRKTNMVTFNSRRTEIQPCESLVRIKTGTGKTTELTVASQGKRSTSTTTIMPLKKFAFALSLPIGPLKTWSIQRPPETAMKKPASWMVMDNTRTAL